MTTSSLILKALVCVAIAAVLLACLRRSRHEAFGAAGIANAHDFRSGARDRVFVLADDVADQDHLRTAVPLGLGRVADRLDVALVEMFQARQDGAARTLVEVTLDLDNGRCRIA